jgi:hypothetical protein
MAEESKTLFACVAHDIVTIPRGAPRIQGHVRRLAVHMICRAESSRVAFLDERLRNAAGLTKPQFKGAIKRLQTWPEANPLIKSIEEPVAGRGAPKGVRKALLRPLPDRWVKGHLYLVHRPGIDWWIRRAFLVIRTRAKGDRFVLNATGRAWDNSLAALMPGNRVSQLKQVDWFIKLARSVGLIYDIQYRVGDNCR